MNIDMLTVARVVFGLQLVALVLVIFLAIKLRAAKREYQDLHESHIMLLDRHLKLGRQPANHWLDGDDKERLELLASQMTAALEGDVYLMGQDDPWVAWEDDRNGHPVITITFCDEDTLEGFVVSATLGIEHCKFEAREEAVAEFAPVAEGATA